ncbi:hypothetical protein [Nostoc sp.]
MPNTSLREAAPTTSLSTSAQYFSTRGCTNDFAQYKCPILLYERLRQRLRSV